MEFLNWCNIGEHNTDIQGAMRLHDSTMRVIRDSADIIYKNAQLTVNLILLELQNLGMTKLRKVGKDACHMGQASTSKICLYLEWSLKR